MAKRKAPVCPVSLLCDVSDDLHKARDLMLVVTAALGGAIHAPEVTLNGAMWILSEIEDLIIASDKSVDAARSVLCRPEAKPC